jgi:DNA-directed RNA polymerase specialized sigma24 family protein
MNEYYLLQDTVAYHNSISNNAHEYLVQNINYKTQPQESSVNSFEEKLIPLSIISGKSSLESIVVYLKDFSNLKFRDIAKLLNRDQRTIWITYANAKKKKLSLKNLDIENDSKLMLPLSIFYSRRFSILESIVLYLRTSHSFSFNQISDLIGKNYQTIRTVYKRALEKISRGGMGIYD